MFDHRRSNRRPRDILRSRTSSNASHSMSHPSSSYDISQSFTHVPQSFSNTQPSFALSAQQISSDLTRQGQESQPDESDLHAFLASELFSPSLNNRQQQAVAPRPVPSCSSNSWNPGPTAPTNYLTEALRLYPTHPAVQQEDVASTPGIFAGHRVGLADGGAHSPDVSVHPARAESTKDRDMQKGEHARRGKKRAALQNEVQLKLQPCSAPKLLKLSGVQLSKCCRAFLQPSMTD